MGFYENTPPASANVSVQMPNDLKLAMRRRCRAMRVSVNSTIVQLVVEWLAKFPAEIRLSDAAEVAEAELMRENAELQASGGFGA